MKPIQFFTNPCFACNHLAWEYDDGEYTVSQWSYCGREHGTHTNKLYDDKESGIFELWSTEKKDFPCCEAPNKCIRKDYWSFKDPKHEDDYFSILYAIEGEAHFFPPYDTDFKNKAVKIAHSVSSFNMRMRNIRLSQT